jgi:NIPSNAP
VITLHLRYTIDPNKLADFRRYAEAEQKAITESGGNILGYFLPTDFAGPTNEAIGVIDVGTLAEYETYRAKLAAHPLHKKNATALERSGALLSIIRSLIQRVEPTNDE